jgi:hypothetical protein
MGNFHRPYQWEVLFDVMPHVILSGIPDFTIVHKQFAPFRADSNGWIIKIQSCLVSADARLLLFDCTAVRSGFSQDFYIRAEMKDQKVTVRVDPYLRIERNEGVQRTIVALAGRLRDQCPELAVSKSNIPENLLQDGQLQ